jgi:hypothetical protein
MLHPIIGYIIIALFYLCFIIVIFAPTIYAAWLYLVTRKLRLKRKGITKLLVYVFAINLIIAYFLAHFAFDYFLGAKTAERDNSVTFAIQNAAASQKKYFTTYGRYYQVGPVRGPYKDEYGLNVDKDVVLYVTPTWDKDSQSESFHAYAIHTWGNTTLEMSDDGKVKRLSPDSEEFTRIRSKLLNSIK